MRLLVLRMNSLVDGETTPRPLKDAAVKASPSYFKLDGHGLYQPTTTARREPLSSVLPQQEFLLAIRRQPQDRDYYPLFLTHPVAAPQN